MKVFVKVVLALTQNYPRVRRCASQRLYESLLTYGCVDNHSELVLNDLANTDWDADPHILLPVRHRIAHALALTLPN